MNTEQLRYFVSVARYRNFTETAREFYVTQPAVTHQISALEREVGARLFLRTTRNVSLTRAGELFLEDAKRILDQEERALGRLRQLESSGCWELRIGYLNSPSRHFLPRLIAAYREAYPQVRVELIRRDATGIQVRGGEEDVEIVSLMGTVSEYGCHLHASFSREDLSAFGGHLLPGCTVNTTAEIVLAEIRSCVFTRRPDSETGYEELEIGPAYPEETRNDRREER